MSALVAFAALISASFTSGTIPEVSLDMEGCASLQRDEIVRLAALELDARVMGATGAGPHATGVRVACDGARVQLTVSDPLTRKQLIRTMELSARAEQVAARIVALAISELVITSWMELTLPSAATATTAREGEGGQPSAELRRAAQERAERHAPTGLALGYILVLGQAIGPFTGVGLGWGGGFRLGWAGRRHLALADGGSTLHPTADLDLAGAWTEVSNSLGTVRVSMWSAAPRASLKLRRGRFWGELGAGGRFGLARLVGAPLDSSTTRGRTLAGTWAGPAAYVGVGALLGRFVITAGIEAGHVLRPVAGRVDGGESVSISGNWLSGSLAMGWGQ